MSDSRIHRLTRLTAAIVLARWEEVASIRRAAPTPEPDCGWREAVLQAHVFAGFPRLVRAYEVLEAEGGLGEPGADELEDPSRDALAPGTELFDRIYAKQAGAVRETLTRYHPDFARSILEHAYGRVLSRPGLTAAERELLAVAGLIALGQHRQLASHARGAVRCGASPEDLTRVVDSLEGLLSRDDLERASMVIKHFQDKTRKT